MIIEKTYQSFQEIAEDFLDGDHIPHNISSHTADECFPWQHGVKEFAAFLDKVGIKMIENPDFEKMLWSAIRPFKPEPHEMKTHKGK